MVSIAQTPVLNSMLSVFMVPLQDEFGWSRSTIAGAITAAAIGAAVVAPIMGPLIDRYGARYFLAAAGLVVGASLVSLSFVQELWHFYLFFGLGRLTVMGVMNLAGQVTVSNWFIRLRGRALGVTMTGQRMGHAVLPIVVQALILAAGWRQAWLVLGLVSAALIVVPSLVFIRRRPEDVGLLPDGDDPDGAGEADKRGPREEDWTVSEALRTPALWLLAAATTLVMFVSSGLNLHMVPYWQDRSLTPVEAVWALAMFAFTAAVASLVWGVVADRIGVRTSLTICLAGSGLTVAYLLTASDAPSAYTFSVAGGFVSGGSFVLSALVYAEYFGRTSLGAIRGVTIPLNWVGNALGPLVAGLVFDISGDYFLIFAVFSGMYLTSALLVGLARRPVRSHGKRSERPETLSAE